MFAGLQNGLQLEALQLLHPGTGQFAVIDKDAHHLLVIGGSGVVGLQHKFLEQLFLLLVGLAKGPLLLWHDDGTQHIAVLHHGGLAHEVVILLQLKLYLVGLHVLAIAQHNDFLPSSSDVVASFLVGACQIACV